ncbi:LysE/ArgO family amino acid transporter [Demequina muriae]|uniref:LysE family transporter n=1 Tax=Demequina muriae TaxID=3051664 RepID=A0ABT8GHZ6_9MICO|nr:LysE family transporter [Demequina sp. EGI L300058]MDN4481055.1 LysE family transporter [Demequina sp. EGI L300058]
MALGLSLIIAIGAQNVFVLRQGLRREHVGLVVTICAASDALLIAAGVAGVGAALSSAPALVTAIRWGGAIFLLGYAVLAARRAWRPRATALEAEGGTAPEHQIQGNASAVPVRTLAPGTASMSATAVTCLALTWLNPHVYLDTVLLLGTIASSHGDARWLFGAGAIVGSIVWFTALGYGARLFSGVLAKPGAWRVLDAAIALVMLALAVTLAAGA